MFERTLESFEIFLPISGIYWKTTNTVDNDKMESIETFYS